MTCPQPSGVDIILCHPPTHGAITTDSPTPSARLLTFFFNSTFSIILDINIPINNPSNISSSPFFDLLNSRDHFLPHLSPYSRRLCKGQHPFERVNLTHPVLWPSSSTAQHTSTTIHLPSHSSLDRPTLPTLTHSVDPATAVILRVSPNQPGLQDLAVCMPPKHNSPSPPPLANPG